MTTHEQRTANVAVSIAATLLLTPLASAQEIEVLYSKIDASSTSDAAWTLDLAGQPAPSKFRSIDDFTVSHDGTQWVLKATNRLGADLQNMLVIGDAGASAAAASNLAQEGQPIPGDVAGALWDFFDTSSPAAFDSAGNLGMSGRAKGPASGLRERIMKRDTAGSWTIVLREGDPLVNLTDTPASSAGDEALGNSVSGVHLLDDGRVGYIVTPLQNCSSFNYPAFLHDDTGFLQCGASAVNSSLGGELWDGMDLGDAGGTPDGTSYFLQGDTDNAATTADDVLAVNNTVVLREGDAIGGSGPVLDAIFQTRMAASGSWISRGDDPAGDDWLVLDGNLIIATGDSVEGGAEAYGASFAACSVNASGDWAVIAKTDNADTALDEVLVVNGLVIAREGDPIDLDGNGLFDDGVFLGDGTPTSSAFAPNDLAITGSGMVYFICRLNDGMGNDLDDSGFSTPDAFVRKQAPNVSAPSSFCFGDGSGTACPCGNPGGAGEGCANSGGAGAKLSLSGSVSVSAADLVLNASGSSLSQPGLFFQGNNAVNGGVGLIFGDGLRCAGGSVIRLEVRTSSGAGTASSSVPIAATGGVAVGNTKRYQWWYRDPVGSPCGSFFNLSNGVEFVWEL